MPRPSIIYSSSYSDAPIPPLHPPAGRARVPQRRCLSAGGAPRCQCGRRGAGRARQRPPLARGASARGVRLCQPHRPGALIHSYSTGTVLCLEPGLPYSALSLVNPSDLMYACFLHHRNVTLPASPPTCPPPPTAPRRPQCWPPATTALGASAGAWWRPDRRGCCVKQRERESVSHGDFTLFCDLGRHSQCLRLVVYFVSPLKYQPYYSRFL